MARFFLGRLTYESRVSSPLVKNYPSIRPSLTIEVYRGSTRIQESVGRQPASCLHSSITGCRENSPAYCSSSIQLFPLSVSRRGSIVNPNRQRFKPRFFLSFFPTDYRPLEHGVRRKLRIPSSIFVNICRTKIGYGRNDLFFQHNCPNYVVTWTKLVPREIINRYFLSPFDPLEIETGRVSVAERIGRSLPPGHSSTFRGFSH